MEEDDECNLCERRDRFVGDSQPSGCSKGGVPLFRGLVGTSDNPSSRGLQARNVVETYSAQTLTARIWIGIGSGTGQSQSKSALYCTSGINNEASDQMYCSLILQIDQHDERSDALTIR
jgi:hypothetical protein